jgi:hypothetical protein
MRDVRCDQDEPDAGQSPALCEIRDLETGVSVRAAQDKGVQTSVGRGVIRIAALSGDEPVILDPAHWLASDAHFDPLANRSLAGDVTRATRSVPG